MVHWTVPVELWNGFTFLHNLTEMHTQHFNAEII
jgi:hypothetical protein